MEFDPQFDLCLEDVNWANKERSSFCLHLKRSKTDPFRQGVHIYYSNQDSLICPGRNLKKYLDAQENLIAGRPLLLHGNQALQRNPFIDMIRSLLKIYRP